MYLVLVFVADLYCKQLVCVHVCGKFKRKLKLVRMVVLRETDLKSQSFEKDLSLEKDLKSASVDIDRNVISVV